MAKVENAAGRIAPEFFENYPLYKPFEFWETVQECVQNVIPAIRIECPRCESVQTFNNPHVTPDKSIPTHNDGRQLQTIGAVLKVELRCAGCEKFRSRFLIRFREDEKTIEKVGQFPEPSVRVPKDIQRQLGDHAANYRKGLISESHGFGIGAFGYYRRIVEIVIDELLDLLAEVIPTSEKTAYEAALAKAKTSRVAQEKIDLVKDLLPDSLRPDGMNPLGVLHHALSEGLHSLDDGECLESATQIRHVLEYLVSQVSLAKDSKKQFTEGMRRLLEKKRPDSTGGHA